MEQSISIALIKSELEIHTARSGGPGGQHVNKVETKVILKWNVKQSSLINELQRRLIIATHKNKMTRKGEFVVVSDNKRSQIKNKEIAFKKLERLLSQAFKKKKKRIPTTPSKAVKRQRLLNKKKLAEKKELRKKII